MKFFLTLFFSFMIFSLQTASAKTVIHIQGMQAKKIYKSMSAIQDDGAAGHIYRKGKNVICRYTNADVDDSQGHLIPNDDARRYACSIVFNKFGHAEPGQL